MKVNKLIGYLLENVDEAALRGFSLDILKKETWRLKAEADYPEEISNGLSKLAEKYKLPYMGRGSSRVVYALSTGKVLKIAVGEKGLAQNEAEVDIWTNPTTKEVAAEVFDFDRDYQWIVMEIAKIFPLRGNRSLEATLGIPKVYGVDVHIDNMIELLLSDRSDGIFSGLDPDTSNLLYQIEELPIGQRKVLERRLNDYINNLPPFIDKLADLVNTNELEIGDIVSSHFGRTSDGRIVLIDYGFTEDVDREHYR